MMKSQPVSRPPADLSPKRPEHPWDAFRKAVVDGFCDPLKDSAKEVQSSGQENLPEEKIYQPLVVTTFGPSEGSLDSEPVAERHFAERPQDYRTEDEKQPDPEVIPVPEICVQSIASVFDPLRQLIASDQHFPPVEWRQDPDVMEEPAVITPVKAREAIFRLALEVPRVEPMSRTASEDSSHWASFDEADTIPVTPRRSVIQPKGILKESTIVSRSKSFHPTRERVRRIMEPLTLIVLVVVLTLAALRRLGEQMDFSVHRKTEGELSSPPIQLMMHRIIQDPVVHLLENDDDGFGSPEQSGFLLEDSRRCRAH